MQRKRNIGLLILLGALALVNVAVYILFRADQISSVDRNLFKVNDLTKVDEVTLTQSQNLLSLKFDGSSWTVNNQPADRRMIDVLFATLQQVQPKRPVAESVSDSIGAVLKNDGVSVKLFSVGEVVKEFVVGGNPNKTQTYFMDQALNAIYIAEIPGYRVYVGGIFELDEGGWKDKYVFNFNWRNFQSLTLKAPSDPKSDFEINMGKVYYEVKGVPAIDTTKLNDFLDAVSLLTVDQYVKKDDVPSYDSLRKSGILLKLQVTDVSGKGYSLDLFESGEKGRVLGIIQGSQLAFFDRKKLTAIAKSQKWFAKK